MATSDRNGSQFTVRADVPFNVMAIRVDGTVLCKCPSCSHEVQVRLDPVPLSASLEEIARQLRETAKRSGSRGEIPDAEKGKRVVPFVRPELASDASYWPKLRAGNVRAA